MRRNTKDLLANIYKNIIIEDGLLGRAKRELCEGCFMEYANQQGHSCLDSDMETYERYARHILSNNLIPEDKVLEALEREQFQCEYITPHALLRSKKTFVRKLAGFLNPERKE